MQRIQKFFRKYGVIIGLPLILLIPIIVYVCGFDLIFSSTKAKTPEQHVTQFIAKCEVARQRKIKMQSMIGSFDDLSGINRFRTSCILKQYFTTDNRVFDGDNIEELFLLIFKGGHEEISGKWLDLKNNTTVIETTTISSLFGVKGNSTYHLSKQDDDSKLAILFIDSSEKTISTERAKQLSSVIKEYLQAQNSSNFLEITSVTPLNMNWIPSSSASPKPSSTNYSIDGYWIKNDRKSFIVIEFFEALKSKADSPEQLNLFDIRNIYPAAGLAIDAGIKGDKLKYRWEMVVPVSIRSEWIDHDSLKKSR